LSVHSIPAGALPVGDERERFSETVPPEAAVPDPSVNDDWAVIAGAKTISPASSRNPKILDIN
jgi:hypothetical protein